MGEIIHNAPISEAALMRYRMEWIKNPTPNWLKHKHSPAVSP
jgi:hypothetical protein